MSWLSRLFGSAQEKAPSEDAPTAEVDYHGFMVRAEPYKSESGQYQVAGTIVKVVDGDERQHRFVRADRLGSVDDATEVSLQKGRQIVDEQGEGIFGRPSAAHT